MAEPTNPPAPATPPAAPAGPAARLDHLEQVQTEQGGKLDRILDLITGDAAGDEQAAHAGAQQHVESKLDRSSAVKALVIQAVKDVGAQQQADTDRAAHAAEHDRLKAPPPDPRPEDPPKVEPTRKQRLQRGLFGGDPS